MKNQLYKRLQLFVLIALAISFIISCVKEDMTTTQQNNNVLNSASKSTNCSASLDFDVEIHTSQRPVNPSDVANLSKFDKIDGEPSIERQEVEVCIFSDGTSEVEIRKKTPTNPIVIPHETPSATEPTVAITRIANGVADFYDNGGNLLHSSSVDPNETDYSDLIGILLQNSGTTPAYTVSEMITMWEDNGYTVTTLPNNFLSVLVVDNTTGEKTDVLFDTVNIRVAGIALLDANNEVQVRTLLKYGAGTTATNIELEEMLMISFEVSPTSGVKLANLVNYHFLSFNFSDNT